MWNDSFTIESKDLSFVDLNPAGLIKLNSKLVHANETYYFSMTHGFQNKISTKPREVFNLSKKISNLSLGFELLPEKEIVFQSKARDKK